MRILPRFALAALLATTLALAASSSLTARPAAASGAQLIPDNALGAHSMLYSTTPLAFKRAMFAQAAAMGVSEIRVDLDLSAVFAASPTPDWSTVDQYDQLAAQYHIRVLADITAIPYWLASCQTPAEQASASWQCGTANPSAYGQLVGQIAQHAKGLIDDFEIINEPDGSWSFSGTPQQYAWMLADADRAVHGANPGARVAIGGIMGSAPWVRAVFATPNANAARSFDIANVHIRAALPNLKGDVSFWKRLFAGYGFRGPLWITEHGYPSDPAYQYDPHYRGTSVGSGLSAQAAYLSRSVPTLVSGGAAKVFITERDNLGGEFASEGILSGQVQDPIGPGPYRIIRKPAFGVIQALAREL